MVGTETSYSVAIIFWLSHTLVGVDRERRGRVGLNAVRSYRQIITAGSGPRRANEGSVRQ